MGTKRGDARSSPLVIGVLAVVATALILSGCGKPEVASAPVGTLEPEVIEVSKVPEVYVAPERALDTSLAPKRLAIDTTVVGTSTAGGSSGGSSGSASLGGDFPISTAIAHIRYLADRVGVRAAGTSGEEKAASYISGQLRQMGYEPTIEQFDLPNGRTSRNVIVTKRGRTDRVIVLGAHMDTKSPSPGANDNASGVATVLAMAQVLAGTPTDATLQFAFFGAEERVGKDPDAHHLGSRHRVARMSPGERSQVAGMVSVDMIAYGAKLHTRTMGRGPQTLSDDLLKYARARGVRMSYLRDQGKTGQSDHEPYEEAGVPAVWVEVRDDPAYHTTSDVSRRVDRDWVARVGQLLLDYVRSRTEVGLAAL